MKGKSQYKGAFIREHGKRVSDIDIRIPRSFTQISVKLDKYSKIYLVCNKTIYGNTKCEFSVRKDMYLASPEKYNNHKCQSIQIDKYFEKKDDENGQFDDITTAAVMLIGHCKLPMNIVNSEVFKNFEAALIKTGQSNPAANLQMLLPNISRTTFTKKFIALSQKMFKEKFKMYQNVPGTSLAIDAGKHKAVPYLMIVIANALIEASPLIIDSVRFFQGKLNSYAHIVEKTITLLLEQNVNIVAIVTDNFKAQVSAINHTCDKSIQHNSTNPEICKIIWISCACHTLALGLCDASKVCAYCDLVEHVIAVARFFRSKNIINLLGLKCPIYTPTRWTGIFDIAHWLVKNSKIIFSKINASLETKTAYDVSDYIIDGFTLAAQTLFVILLPFSIATHLLEADNLPAAYAVPIINDAIKLFEENCESFSISDSIKESIIECINRRMKFSQSGRIFQLLYSLTPLGREEIRSWDSIESRGTDQFSMPKSFSLKMNESESTILESLRADPTFLIQQAEQLKNKFAAYKCKLLSASNGRKLIEHEGEEEADDEQDDYDSNANSSSDIEMNYMAHDSSSTDDKETDDSSTDYDDSSEEDSDLTEDEVTEHSYGPLEANIVTLKEIASLQGYSSDSLLNIVTEYADWLLDDPRSLHLHEEFLIKGYKCWLYYQDSPKLHNLAKFAYQLMEIVASEAS